MDGASDWVNLAETILRDGASKRALAEQWRDMGLMTAGMYLGLLEGGVDKADAPALVGRWLYVVLTLSTSKKQEGGQG